MVINGGNSIKEETNSKTIILINMEETALALPKFGLTIISVTFFFSEETIRVRNV